MKSNMYKLSVKQWSPFVGCLYQCSYCIPSFQAQLKRWGKKHCRLCYEYKPHAHPERLDKPLPKTRYMQFIFCCDSGDIAFAPTDYLEKIVDRIKREKDKTFLIQSKNPATFKRVKWPDNVILGTTIETNRDELVKKISKAPPPSKRIKDFLEVDHRYKMITHEPIMDFDLPIMLKWDAEVNPLIIWMGYDSRKTGLIEPPLIKFRQLHWELSKLGYTVILKTVRKPVSALTLFI